jgi:hypothetical protein
VVQVAITVDYDFLPKVLVHNIPLEKDSGFWDNMPKRVTCVEDFQQILRKLDDFSVCAGNFEPHFEHLLLKGVPAGKIGAKSEYCGYKEWDFGELHQSNRLNSTMRSMRCALLHKDAPRCGACTKFRKTLNGMLRREKDQQPLSPKGLITSTKPVKHMSEDEISLKIKALQDTRKKLMAKSDTLAHKNIVLQRKINDKIRCEGVHLGEQDSNDLKELLKSHNESDECNEYEKLFMQQQLKFNTVRDKKGMRWHPTIIKWCIFLKSKSSKAYKTMRDSGFIHLPSERTLYDYSHYTKGFLNKICCILQVLVEISS